MCLRDNEYRGEMLQREKPLLAKNEKTSDLRQLDATKNMTTTFFLPVEILEWVSCQESGQKAGPKSGQKPV